MDLSTYQQKAARTDQVIGQSERAKLIPLLGLAGEVGSLLSGYKKFLRDGRAHARFEEEVAEDLGDLLWYVASAASKFGLDLEAIAQGNLDKTSGRWHALTVGAQCSLFDGDPTHLFDYDYPEAEQLPRHFIVDFKEIDEEGKLRVLVSTDAGQLGNELTDNAYEDDGYRFHDVFHLSYAAVLGWSPIVRKHLNRKRRSKSQVDEVEDGARAGLIEELISQLVFNYAREHNYLEGTGGLDYHLLKTIQSLVADREVRVRTLAEWEQAILDGYAVWRHIREHRGGKVSVDLVRRRIQVANEPSP